MSASLKLSELISSLSYALDITEGQPEGHCIRSCWIGMHIGAAMGLEEQQLWELYYAILLKDLGCSSNASRICELYLVDDRQFKSKSPFTAGHSQRVGHYADCIAAELGMTAERRRSCFTALENVLGREGLSA